MMDLFNKQFWENNLWYGENSRERNHAEFLKSLTSREREAILTVNLPDQSRIWGVDISHWNLPPVALKRMVEEFGMSFVIIKGCDGSLNTKYYFEHVAVAKEAGIPWGMYVWLYASRNVSIDAQVNAWVARYNIDPPPMGIFVDAEKTIYAGVVSNPTGSDLRAAHDKTKIKIGKDSTTYTAKYFADEFLKGFDFKREELWVANYEVNVPVLPIGAPTYTIHQFTASLDGKTLDPNGNYDLDGNYYKDKDLFKSRFGGGTIPDPDTDPGNGEPMTETHEGTIKQTLNVRAGPGTTYAQKLPPLGYLLTGDRVYGVLDTSTSWFHIGRIIRKSGAVEIFDAWASAAGWNTSNPPYMLVVPYSPDVEPDPVTPKQVTVVVDLEGYKPKTMTATLEPDET